MVEKEIQISKPDETIFTRWLPTTEKKIVFGLFIYCLAVSCVEFIEALKGEGGLFIPFIAIVVFSRLSYITLKYD